MKRFPFLLIDESQDTNKHLISSIFKVQIENENSFCVGLLGDMMQRVYFDGQENLHEIIPDSWKTPQKVLNHRCPKRIVDLLNLVRAGVDGQYQESRTDAKQGIVRLFIAGCEIEKKNELEEEVRHHMMDVCEDEGWGDENTVQTLILEHHMAAYRLGFASFFIPIYKVDKYRTGLLDASIPEVSILWKVILPVVKGMRKDDEFSIISLVRKYSELYDKEKIMNSENQIQYLKMISRKIDNLFSLWDNENDPTIGEVFKLLSEIEVFPLSQVIIDSLVLYNPIGKVFENLSEELNCWLNVFEVKFSEVEKYFLYVTGASGFETHQGVKGLEYRRVFTILDDSASSGFMFKYDKLFGVAPLTPKDKENIKAGKDSAVSRPQRLFYVACSRAKDSLAVLSYSQDLMQVKKHAIDSKWFDESEIIEIGVENGKFTFG